MTPEQILRAAIRQAINDADGAAATPDDLLTLQAEAAYGAVVRLGWVERAGWEYAARSGDVTLSCGFHTFQGAEDDAETQGFTGYSVERRPIGVWELAILDDDTLGTDL